MLYRLYDDVPFPYDKVMFFVGLHQKSERRKRGVNSGMFVVISLRHAHIISAPSLTNNEMTSLGYSIPFLKNTVSKNKATVPNSGQF